MPIDRSDPIPNKKDKVYRSVSHRQFELSKHKVIMLYSDSIEDDSKSNPEGSDQSSSVFDSENERPISSPSNKSSNHESPDSRVRAEQIKRNMRVQSAMQDEGPACWQMQN